MRQSTKTNRAKCKCNFVGKDAGARKKAGQLAGVLNEPHPRKTCFCKSSKGMYCGAISRDSNERENTSTMGLKVKGSL